MAVIELIIGNKRIRPTTITPVEGGLEAVLQGEALVSVLDATFLGSGCIEASGGEMDRCRLEVSAIEMLGGSTRITLVPSSAPARLH